MAAFCKLLSGKFQSPYLLRATAYRLVYVRNGLRVVGFDNERGKGDHMHLGRVERPYQFKGVAQLLEDFAVEVNKRRE
nr:DUF6516 family protein [Bordetella sp. LUAb4]